jgi:hypothetical protein
VRDSGLFLHDIRERLVDLAAARQDSDSAPGAAQNAARRHQVLREAVDRAEAGSPDELTVRELMALWGAKARGHRVNQWIEADLDNHGLRSSPNSATSSSRRHSANSREPRTLNERCTDRRLAGSNPTTTLISHTPGRRSRIEPVPLDTRRRAPAASL